MLILSFWPTAAWSAKRCDQLKNFEDENSLPLETSENAPKGEAKDSATKARRNRRISIAAARNLSDFLQKLKDAGQPPRMPNRIGTEKALYQQVKRYLSPEDLSVMLTGAEIQKPTSTTQHPNPDSTRRAQTRLDAAGAFSRFLHKLKVSGQPPRMPRGSGDEKALYGKLYSLRGDPEFLKHLNTEDAALLLTIKPHAKNKEIKILSKSERRSQRIAKATAKKLSKFLQKLRDAGQPPRMPRGSGKEIGLYRRVYHLRQDPNFLRHLSAEDASVVQSIGEGRGLDALLSELDSHVATFPEGKVVTLPTDQSMRRKIRNHLDDPEFQQRAPPALLKLLNADSPRRAQTRFIVAQDFTTFLEKLDSLGQPPRLPKQTKAEGDLYRKIYNLRDDPAFLENLSPDQHLLVKEIGKGRGLEQLLIDLNGYVAKFSDSKFMELPSGVLLQRMRYYESDSEFLRQAPPSLVKLLKENPRRAIQKIDDPVSFLTTEMNQFAAELMARGEALRFPSPGRSPREKKLYPLFLLYRDSAKFRSGASPEVLALINRPLTEREQHRINNARSTAARFSEHVAHALATGQALGIPKNIMGTHIKNYRYDAAFRKNLSPEALRFIEEKFPLEITD